MYKSPTYGKIGIEQIPDKILMFYNDHLKFESQMQIIIGTDSQNFDKTKVVSVVAVICEGSRWSRRWRMTGNTRRCI